MEAFIKQSMYVVIIRCTKLSSHASDRSWFPKSVLCFQLLHFEYMMLKIYYSWPSGKLETESGKTLRKFLIST